MAKRQLQMWSVFREEKNGIGIHQWMAVGDSVAALVMDETDQTEHVE